MPNEFNARIQHAGKTAAQWASANPVLLARELGIETDTDLFKIGDGTTAWNDLGYGGLRGEDGADGVDGLSLIDTNTDTTITGLLTGNGSKVSATSPLALPLSTLDLRENARARIGHTRANNMLRSTAFPIPAAMNPPPTYSLSAANAATSIANGFTYPVIVNSAPSPNFTFWNGNPVIGGDTFPFWTVTRMSSFTIPNSHITPLIEAFHHGRFLEIEFLGQNHPSQVFVNGAPITVNTASQSPSLTNPGIGNYRIILDFGSVALRRVGYRSGNQMVGWTVGPTDTVFPTGKAGVPRCIVIGDSFTEGAGTINNNLWLGWASLLCEALGVDGWIHGSGGTGYLQTNGVRGTFRSRIVADCINWNPDIVIISGGINDSSFTPAAVGTEAGLLFDQIITALPNARLIVTSPFWINGSPSTNLTNIATQIRTAATSRGLAYIDFFSPLLWRGTGNAASPTGSGNSDVITSTDLTHPSTVGHQIIAARAYQAIRGLL